METATTEAPATTGHNRYCGMCGTDMGDDPPYGICGWCEDQLMGWSDERPAYDDHNDANDCPACGSSYTSWDGGSCYCMHCGYTGK